MKSLTTLDYSLHAGRNITWATISTSHDYGSVTWRNCWNRCISYTYDFRNCNENETKNCIEKSKVNKCRTLCSLHPGKHSIACSIFSNSLHFHWVSWKSDNLGAILMFQSRQWRGWRQCSGEKWCFYGFLLWKNNCRTKKIPRGYIIYMQNKGCFHLLLSQLYWRFGNTQHSHWLHYFLEDPYLDCFNNL